MLRRVGSRLRDLHRFAKAGEGLSKPHLYFFENVLDRAIANIGHQHVQRLPVQLHVRVMRGHDRRAWPLYASSRPTMTTALTFWLGMPPRLWDKP